MAKVAKVAKWATEANHWMTLAKRYIKDDRLSAASSALHRAEAMIPKDKLTKGTDAAWNRFARLNDQLMKAYGG